MTKTKLRLSTRRWLNKIKAGYVLELHHEQILELAGASWDRALEAKEAVDQDGAYIEDRFQQIRAHPAIDIQLRSTITYSRLMREIGLDLEPPPDRPARTPAQY
ncbi:unnamed protein product [marine sediment metagenome]|uniref:Uncharacterized protein n=1 Tax=marine sediment metagenome TaxID=412755 RepID=X0Y6Q3_9ZZZZ